MDLLAFIVAEANLFLKNPRSRSWPQPERPMSKKRRYRPKPPPRPMQSIFASLGRTWVVRIFWACIGLLCLGMALTILVFGPPEHPEPIPRVGFETWEVVLIFLAWFGISSFTFIAWQLALYEVQASGQKPIRILWNAGMVLLNVLVILLVIDVFGLRLSGQNWEDLGFRKLSLGWIVGSFALGIVAMVLSGAVAALVMRLLEQEWVNQQDKFILPKEQSTAPVEVTKCPLSKLGALAMLVLVGIAVPIVEEMLFRGVLYAWMTEKMPWLLAAILSSLAFGLAHFESGRPVMAACAVAGFFMAIAFHYSHSLLAPIIIHSVNNLTKVGLTYWLHE